MTAVMTGHGVALRLDRAASLDFVPTTTGPRWRGKFKCVHCATTGYVTYELLNWPYWWGRKHGVHCSKRAVV